MPGTSWGTFVGCLGGHSRQALAGARARGALSGPPVRTYPGRPRVELLLRQGHPIGSRGGNPSRRSPKQQRHPAGSRGGNPLRGYGKRPARRPVGGSAAGRFRLLRGRPGMERPGAQLGATRAPQGRSGPGRAHPGSVLRSQARRARPDAPWWPARRSASATHHLRHVGAPPLDRPSCRAGPPTHSGTRRDPPTHADTFGTHGLNPALRHRCPKAPEPGHRGPYEGGWTFAGAGRTGCRTSQNQPPGHRDATTHSDRYRVPTRKALRDGRGGTALVPGAPPPPGWWTWPQRAGATALTGVPGAVRRPGQTRPSAVPDKQKRGTALGNASGSVCLPDQSGAVRAVHTRCSPKGGNTAARSHRGGPSRRQGARGRQGLRGGTGGVRTRKTVRARGRFDLGSPDGRPQHTVARSA